MKSQQYQQKIEKKKEKLELATLWMAQLKKQTTSKFGSQ